MKLVQEGELGILLDPKQVESLNTVAKIDDEINRISLGNYEPVKRDHDTVVAPAIYSEYLYQRKQQIQQQAKPIVPPMVPSTPVKDNSDSLIRERDALIRRLLFVAKSETKRANVAEQKLNDNQLIHYGGKLESTDESTNANINRTFVTVIKRLSTHKFSESINILVARGLVGDERAKVVIDSIYGDDTFDTFISQMKGDKANDDNNNESQSNASQSDSQ